MIFGWKTNLALLHEGIDANGVFYTADAEIASLCDGDAGLVCWHAGKLWPAMF